jgi:hypothetical protein
VYDNGVQKSQQVIAENVTIHDLPLWFPRDPKSHGFMFFDELNRGSRDTQQWAMQMVLDYKSNFVELPMGWRVVSACNDNQDIYNVLALDPALYDRFLVIKFQPTIPEWLSFADKNDVHDAIIKYITKFGNDLDVPEKVEAGRRYPSRRSWVKLSNTLKYMAEQGNDPLSDLDYLLLLTKGYVGDTVAVNFTEFVKKEYKVYSAEEILNNFPKLREEFKKMIATDFAFYNKILVTHIKKSGVKKLKAEQNANIFEYVKTIPREVASGFWGEFRKECPDASGAWYKSNPAITAYVRGLLNKESSMDITFNDSVN